ncbi:MAG TPA: valine--tRNA ligase [Candidatus Paceibacterota bacterium]
MEPRYDPAVEKKIYDSWEQSGYFDPDVCVEKGVTASDAEPFCVVLPPPNVTGVLHIGHAYEDTLQDIVVRHARMRGMRTLWIPGTDHAAIATQAKVEKEILKVEKKSRRDLGREEFLRRVNEFAQVSHDTIVQQIKRLGASLDWTREAYTLDEKRNLGVRTAFKKMYDLGLIYRASRVVNWDPKGQTVISDDEVQHEERTTKLYTFRYDKNFPIPVATTRLETKFGDTAVAVHPDDKRYAEYVGKTYHADFCGVPLTIRVIADPTVEKDFGTGALGVTPAHSIVDWEIAQRHDLAIPVSIINLYGKMINVPKPFEGETTATARAMVADELKKRNLIEKEEDVKQNVSIAERTGAIIEPLPALQWFVDVDKQFKQNNGHTTTLKALMREAVESGGTTIVPERFEKIYFHWIDNLRDWCISRQIWFGHRIPVWYRERNGVQETHVDIDPPKDDGWEQDPDTLDTWFSSGLWPFSTLGWPDKTKDLEIYFPNSFMDPGYEILQLWVARMILMSGVIMEDVPFRKVLIHGIVRDSKGEKFSKSKGNGIDPLLLADKYGADALRMTLVIGAAPGNDVKFDEQRVKGYRNFSTKIWNIARFIQMNKPEGFADDVDAGAAKHIAAREEIKELAALKAEVTKHIDDFEFHLAAEKLYHYVWHTLADKIIEQEKKTLAGGTDAEKSESYALLEHLLLGSLTMLHPFMPFITEEIYQIFRPGKMLMVEQW